ncbi:hypothetical protein Tco_1308616, partial [Tanacetum coccineum]
VMLHELVVQLNAFVLTTAMKDDDCVMSSNEKLDAHCIDGCGCGGAVQIEEDDDFHMMR